LGGCQQPTVLVNKINLKNGEYLYLSDYNIIINKEFSNIFQKNSKNKYINFPKDKISIDIIKTKIKDLKQLSLEITHDCNLKCKYCVYGGNYLYERVNSKKYMDFDVAKKSILYIYNTIKDRVDKTFNIGFYGGEPLLNFEIIKKIVQFSKKLFKNWFLEFQITTNGTIFNKEIIEFLVLNDFFTLISLDGPKENMIAKEYLKMGKDLLT